MVGSLGRAIAWCVALASTALAGGLALVRMSGSDRASVVEAVAFTPLGVPAAALGLVLALALVRRSRVGAGLLGVASALLLLAHASWQAPYVLGPVPRADGDGFVVAAQNFEHGHADALVDLVRRHRVDVLVVTDVGGARMDELERAGMSSLLPFAAGTDRGSAVLSRVPVLSSERISDGGDSRTARLDVAGVGEVELVALHPTPPYQGGKWAEDWRRILAHLEADQSPVPRIVAGDLNATLDHPPLHRLADLGLTDAAAATNAGWSPTWPANRAVGVLGIGIPPVMALDHVLAGGGLVSTAFAVDSAVGSDHAAVIATVACERADCAPPSRK